MSRAFRFWPLRVRHEQPASDRETFDDNFVPNAGDRSPIEGANGDMGENDTAGLDPIFFFHHCFIDRVFWLWQKRHGFTDRLEVIEGYPGTNSVDSQGPTPGTIPNAWLSLASPLDPFKRVEDGKERSYTSLNCINIETQLGFTHGPGSLEEAPKALASADAPNRSAKMMRVSGHVGRHVGIHARARGAATRREAVRAKGAASRRRSHTLSERITCRRPLYANLRPNHDRPSLARAR